MKKQNLKTYLLPVFALFLAVAVWCSASFLKKSYHVLPKILSSKLPFKESPVKLGGYEAVNIYLTNSLYPCPDYFDNQSAKELLNHIEIENYIVRFPLNLIFKKTWNIDIKFKDLKFNENIPCGFDLLKGAIYFEINSGVKTGLNKPRYANENITFPEDFFWDYKIEFNSYNVKAKMYSTTSGKEYNVEYILLDNKTLRFKIPFVEKINAKMNKNEMGNHIAAFGFSSINDKDRLIISKYFPNEYYSFAANNISPDSNGFVKLMPISINNTGMVKKINEEDVLKILETIVKSDSAKNNFKPSDFELIKSGYEMYEKHKYSDAETELLKYKGSSSTANAILGVLTAKKAKKEKNVIKKIQYVENAYKIFDKGEKLIKSDGDKYIFYMNRIGTSMEVPDEVFDKLKLAENDLKILLTLNLTEKEKAGCYLKLIKIYKTKKNKELNNLFEEIKKEFNEAINKV